jgi:hypothetical protein
MYMCVCLHCYSAYSSQHSGGRHPEIEEGCVLVSCRYISPEDVAKFVYTNVGRRKLSSSVKKSGVSITATTYHTQTSSLPLRRVYGIKRTYLAPHIHGLFIT